MSEKIIVYKIYTIKILYISGEEYLEKFNYRKWSSGLTLKDYRSEPRGWKWIRVG